MGDPPGLFEWFARCTLLPTRSIGEEVVGTAHILNPRPVRDARVLGQLEKLCGATIGDTLTIRLGDATGLKSHSAYAHGEIASAVADLCQGVPEVIPIELTPFIRVLVRSIGPMKYYASDIDSDSAYFECGFLVVEVEPVEDSAR